MISQIASSSIRFWEKHPALLIGSLLLLGTAFSLHRQPIELCLLVGFIFPFIFQTKPWKMCSLLIAIFLMGWISSSYRAPLIQLNEPKMEGTARFAISSVKPYQSPFHRSLVYKGELVWFQSEQTEIRGVPCQIYLPFSKARPKADKEYLMSGTLVQKEARTFIFKPQKHSAWKPIASTYRLAELRYRAKQTIHAFLSDQFKHSNVATFLNALATGEVDERNLSMEFGRVGLQHILAISGFHFALIALFLNVILQLVLPQRLSSMFLILLLSSYYLFLGDSPSVQRAWIAITALLIGKIFNRRITGLNALGVGLCAEILIDPMVISQIGFILSFLCTWAILLLVPLTRSLCDKLLPSRTFSIAKSMSPLDQWGYIIGSFLRQSLSINLAVHLACLPVLLHLFHRFPLLSLVYNLFFPFWVSVSLLLLCTACLLSLLLPPLAHLLFLLNDYWTYFALNVTSHPPAFLDFVVRTQSFSYSAVLLFLFLIFMVAIRLTEEKRFQLPAVVI